MLLCLLWGCRKKEVTVPSANADLDYYPLVTGRFSVFQCDSIVYTEIPRDTLHYRYQVKEILGEQFTDAEGKPAFMLRRFIRKYDPVVPYDSLPWLAKDVWQVNADQQKVQVVEENERYTKLVFPVTENKNWNGNAANSKPEALYTYTYKDRAESIDAISLAKVLNVQQTDFRTLISLEQASEKYARSTGLVYRSYTELYSNTIVPQVKVEDRIEKGVVYTQKLIAYGQE